MRNSSCGVANDSAPTGLHGYALLATARGCDTAWLLALGVEEPWRRKGYGRELLACCLRELVDPGLREIRLSVEPGNVAAVRLYRSLGFAPADPHPDYLGPGRDRLIMILMCRAAPNGDSEARTPTAETRRSNAELPHANPEGRPPQSVGTLRGVSRPAR
ncbi:GNAT family N-acetyltransferase [Streptomyces sp.]|uniref:GNAT family N-acetyltransferase n=1 Tax=Streptomyces sp. TaxID=1931 RepID=UPI002F3F0E6D